MRQGIVLPETPRERREQAALEEDLRSIPLTRASRSRSARGTSARARTRTSSRPAGRSRTCCACARSSSERTDHEEALRAAWRVAGGRVRGDAARFRATLARRGAGTLHFDEVNDLIDRHNRWYPVESRLPMDPRRGDYALVNGRDYRLAAARRGLGARALSAAFSSARRACTESSRTPRERGEWRSMTLAELAVTVALLGALGLVGSAVRALGDSRVSARRAPARPERARGSLRSSARRR